MENTNAVHCPKCGKTIAKHDRDGQGAVITARQLLLKSECLDASCPVCKTRISITNQNLRYLIKLGV